MRSNLQAIFAGVLLLAGSFTLTACDSGDDDTIDVAAIIGTYTFTQWTFNPDATQLTDANVLDTLVAASTSLRFTSDNRFLLGYQFRNTPNDLFITGTFSIQGNEVRLRIDGSFESARKKLILPGEFNLRILSNGAQLEASINRTVDLTEFSNSYSGIPPVAGNLLLKLRKR